MTITNSIHKEAMIEKEFCKVPITNVIMGIIEGINKIRLTKMDDSIFQLKQPTKDGYVNLSPFNDLSIDKTRSLVSISQIQLFMYLLSKWSSNSGESTFVFERSDYFTRYKMVKSHHKNNKQLERDLHVLSNIDFQMLDKNKKRRTTHTDNLLSFEKKKSSVYQVQFSDWIHNLDPHIYILLHKNFFKYHGKNDWFTAMLSFKVAQKAGIDLMKLSQGKISVKSVFEFAGVTNDVLLANGFARYSKLLFDALQKMEGENYKFNLSFVNGELTFTTLKKSMISFQHEQLYKHYMDEKPA